MNLEHERCSELLGPLLRGELSEQQATSVEDHIAGCEECRAEKEGLQALIGAPALMSVPAEPLTEFEKARLRRAVAGAMPAASPAARTIVSEPGKPWAARIAPYLGTAAALILVVFGATQLDLGGSDDDSGAGDGTAIEQDSSGGGRGADEGASNDTAVTSGEALAEDGAPAPGPSFEPEAGDIERTGLRRFGSTDPLFKSFALTLTTDDAESLNEQYLRDLASAGAAAGDPATITECGQQVLTSQDSPTLPAYAGYGELEKKDVLMMGFVYSGADAGPLDKFMLWIWPRDDCSIPSEYQFGKIKP